LSENSTLKKWNQKKPKDGENEGAEGSAQKTRVIHSGL
jgi:hypothetical protein